MIYILKTEGEKQIEISAPREKDGIWIIEQNDYEFWESTRYEFETEDQAKLFLESHIHSYVVDGFELTTTNLLTDDNSVANI